MNPEYWKQLQILFHDLVGLDGDAQKAYLDECCANNSQLRIELEELINNDQVSTSTIKNTIESEVTKALCINAQSGERVGAYRLLTEVGSGGMGVVFLAERADDEFKKKVAIKLLRYTLLSDEEKQRFRNERQLLANLEHPNIARLLDGGSREDGSTYIVMEYIHGSPVDSYSKQKQLSIHDRLHLFLQVSDAIEYAHKHHILHLDIKPENILVTDEGVVKLLDFGIAKLSYVEKPLETAFTNDESDHILTLEYASPELIRGDQLSVSSDVYAMGILLYELLSGNHPYKSLEQNMEGKESYICNVEPARPSNAAGSATDCRRLRGDLDKIIMKAIAKKPIDRYSSVADLSDDIRRFLSKRPIKARHASIFYNFSRLFSRRKNTVVALTLIIFIISMFTAAIFTIQKKHQTIVQEIIAKHTFTTGDAPPSIMVFPLANANKDPEINYFSMGLSKELIDDLSRLEGIHVISPDSIVAYQNNDSDPIAIASSLGVDFVIHGFVYLTNEKVTVDVTLSDANTGLTQWTKIMSSSVEDLFSLQNTLAIKLAQALHIDLSEEELRWLDQNDTYSFEAYDAFLRGLSHYSQRTITANREAREYFDRAIEIDPGFARSYATLANTYRSDYVNGWTAQPEKSLSTAELLVSKALALDDRSPQIHFVKGLVLREKKLHTQALASAAQAIALNPNYADGFVLMASIMCYSDTPENSVSLIKKAMSLNPKHPTNYSFHLGQCNYVQENFTEAIKAFEQALERNPVSQRTNIWLAASYAQSGNKDDAEWVVNEMLAGNRKLNIKAVTSAVPFTNAAAQQLLINGLKKAGLPARYVGQNKN